MQTMLNPQFLMFQKQLLLQISALTFASAYAMGAATHVPNLI